MKRLHRARFLVGAASPAQFPQLPFAEVAFVGRSNAGKSSLLNCLIGGRPVARVSKTPGRTQQINFFLVDECLTLADLPGYGFAKVSAALRRHWAKLIEEYLATRKQLRVVLLLMDIRRQIEKEELELVGRLREWHIPSVLVATKADKVTQGEKVRKARAWEAELRPLGVEVIVSSAVTGEGIQQIWRTILQYCQPLPEALDTRGRH